MAYKARRNTAVKRLVVRPPLPRGVYLWGPVGRGKSFLMDSFYLSRAAGAEAARALPPFHARRAPRAGRAQGHARIRSTRLPGASRKRYRLICFDEFHVNDIADAMILGRFLSGRWTAGWCTA